jgi:hypothetical protein
VEGIVELIVCRQRCQQQLVRIHVLENKHLTIVKQKRQLRSTMLEEL